MEKNRKEEKNESNQRDFRSFSLFVQDGFKEKDTERENTESFLFFLQHQLLGQLCNFDRLQQIKGKQHKFVYIHIS